MTFADFRVAPGQTCRLKRYRTDETLGMTKAEPDVTELAALHDLLYAEHKHALLIVLQGMDAAGKDGTIRHVMSGVNPQGCRVTCFKVPSDQELEHDYLWRVHQAVPERGTIGIFNRSHYEDVLVPRVHKLLPKKVIEQRYREINDFERMLAANGVTILKFFLHVSREEQARRLQARLTDPSRHWKASAADFQERQYWTDYQAAYEAVLSRCSTAAAPWYVIPADHKWFRNWAVSRLMVRALKSLKMSYPEGS